MRKTLITINIVMIVISIAASFLYSIQGKYIGTAPANMHQDSLIEQAYEVQIIPIMRLKYIELLNEYYDSVEQKRLYDSEQGKQTIFLLSIVILVLIVNIFHIIITRNEKNKTT